MEDATVASEDTPSGQKAGVTHTTTSRFFPSHQKPATIFVPNSSPSPQSVYKPKMGHHPPTNGKPPAAVYKGRMMEAERRNISVQKLSAPSASASTSSSRASSLRRSRDDSDEASVEAPPKKKPFPSRTSSSMPDRPSTPDSLQPVKVAMKNVALGGSPSLDSSSPEKPRGRLVKGRPQTPVITQDSHNLDIANNAIRTPLDNIIQTHPNVDPNRIRDLWRSEGGDPARVIAVLAGRTLPSTGPPPKPSIPLLPTSKLPSTYNPYSPRPSFTTGTTIGKLPPPVSYSLKPSSKPIIKRAASEEDSDVYDSESEGDEEMKHHRVEQALKWFNSAPSEQLVEVTTCTPEQAQSIISVRPFADQEDMRRKLRRKKGVSPRYFDDYVRMLEGYETVDEVIAKCEKVGKDISEVLAVWASAADANADSSVAAGDSGAVTTEEDALAPKGAAIDLVAIAPDAIPERTAAAEADSTSELREKALEGYIRVQPALMGEGVVLKDYQLLGINWLRLLHQRKLSCILADEMGLGKTIQVIAFFAHLKENGKKGPHIVIVPSSTLENWGREFERFAPQIPVVTYYGTQKERMMQRAELMDDIGNWDVLLTTYNLAQGTEHDRRFFKKINWECSVFDEAHVLKNFQSQRYLYLVKIPSRWRLMLTGTPLQNNLQELVSLMNFLLPNYFEGVIESLRAIFKTTASSSASFLSESRVTRASKMMTPFVLRRRKDQVLKDLPKKVERIEWCEMTAMQKSIYDDALKRSRNAVVELPPDPDAIFDVIDEQVKKTPGRPKKNALVSSGVNSSNILMDLRKASSHPMLFRRLFDDDKIKVIARHCLSEPEFAASNFDLVVEDMSVMNDAELQRFCKQYSSVRKHALDDAVFLEAGKISALLKMLAQYKEEDKRVLIFSQFTQILDILKVIFHQLSIDYLILTGQTAVSERQALVDNFNEDESIPVFLLSTKAGGMGINLTAACVVIIFDQDFNPHNDKQACDRAYRIGQKRDVEVVKLITRGTIEESMLRLGKVKLVLDQAVTAGEGTEEGEEGATEKTMKASLLSELRKQFEDEEAALVKVKEQASSALEIASVA